MGIEKFKTLAGISSNNEKMKFVKENETDKEFIDALRFFCDDSIVTNISSKKLDKKLKETHHTEITSVDMFVEFISQTSGTDSEVLSVKKFIEKNPDISEILTGLVIKKYPVKFGAKFFNREIKGKPIKVNPYMGCISYSKKKVDELFEKNGYLLSQIKNDGQFLNLFINVEGEEFTARSGIKQYIGGPLLDTVKIISDAFPEKFVITGELMIRGYDRHTANGIIRSLISSNKKIAEGDQKEASKFEKKYKKTIEEIERELYVVAWDLVRIKEFLELEDENRTSYGDRLRELEKAVETLGNNPRIVVTEYRVVKNFKEAMLHLKEVLEKGGEGTVLKSLDDNYFENGKPNYQIKMKVEFTVDLEIVSINEGKKGSEREGKLGSVDAKSSCGEMVTGVSGFDEKMQEEIWNNKEKYIGKIIEVKCNGTSKNRDGGRGLLYANFKSVRDDKEKADTLEEILNAERAAFSLESMVRDFD